MAFCRTYAANDTPFGVAYSDAYVRISKLAIDDTGTGEVELQYWENEDAAKSGSRVPWLVRKQPITGFDHSGAGLKAQAYTLLRELQEFRDAQNIQPGIQAMSAAIRKPRAPVPAPVSVPAAHAPTVVTLAPVKQSNAYMVYIAGGIILGLFVAALIYFL